MPTKGLLRTVRRPPIASFWRPRARVGACSLFYVCRKNFEAIEAVTALGEEDPVAELRSRFFNLIHVADVRQMEITFVYQESHTLRDEYVREVKAWDERAVDNVEEPLKAAVAAGLADLDRTRVAARQMVETGYASANRNWALRAS